MPEEDPEMFIEKDTLEVGYTLRGNCTSPPSYPHANITWFLNGKRVSSHFILSLKRNIAIPTILCMAFRNFLWPLIELIALHFYIATVRQRKLYVLHNCILKSINRVLELLFVL